MAATDMVITPTGAGDKSGIGWANAMDIPAWEADMEGASEPGDRYFPMGGVGAYELQSNIAAMRNGTQQNNICIYGVKPGTTNYPPEETDWADWVGGEERPLIDEGEKGGVFFRVQHYWDVRNMWFRKRGSIAGGYAFRGDHGGYCINSKFENLVTGVGDSWALYRKGGAGATIIDCELVCTNGFAISMENTKVAYCQAHDSRVGYQIDAGYNTIIGSIADKMTESGIYIPEASFCMIIGNTINDCERGIDNENAIIVTGYLSIFNNILSNCGTGIHYDAATLGDYIDWNNYWNNTDDVVNAVKGANAMAIDPDYNNESAGDLSLDPSESELIRAGFGIRLGVGVI